MRESNQREQDWEMFYFVKLVNETDKAYNIDFYGTRTQSSMWIPKSQSRNIDLNKGTIELTEWIAKEKGLI